MESNKSIDISGYEGKQEVLGIGFPFARERKHIKYRDRREVGRGEELGKGNAYDT